MAEVTIRAGPDEHPLSRRGPPPPPPPGEPGLEKIRREILQELAVPRVGNTATRIGSGDNGEGWTFIEPTDQVFIDAHPQLAQTEAERWQAIAPWLEADPTAAAALQAPPLPMGIHVSVAAKAQALVLPVIRKAGVIKLSAIRALLQRSGDVELTPCALLREPEMLGLLGGNVVSIDGACALATVGDTSMDPFRSFLLKMLRTRGRTVRRKDIEEGAAAALGAPPSNAVYVRCLTDLCVSRGSTWVMKSGETNY